MQTEQSIVFLISLICLGYHQPSAQIGVWALLIWGLQRLKWRINLSKATVSGHDNSLWVFFNGTNIQFQITDAAGGKTTINTNVPVPRGKWSFWVMARGGHLIFSMRTKYTSSGVENSIGLGYTKLLDIYVPRCGSPYSPYLATTNVSLSGTLQIDALCSADATRADGGGLRYMPSTSNRALYYDTEITASEGVTWRPNAAGSDSYHMNNFGVRDLLYPVISVQDWRATTGLTTATNTLSAPQGYVQAENLQTSGFLHSVTFVRAATGIAAWNNNPDES